MRTPFEDTCTRTDLVHALLRSTFVNFLTSKAMIKYFKWSIYKNSNAIYKKAATNNTNGNNQLIGCQQDRKSILWFIEKSWFVLMTFYIIHTLKQFFCFFFTKEIRAKISVYVLWFYFLLINKVKKFVWWRIQCIFSI